MSKISLIIKREYLSRVRKKSFLVMTILGPLLIVGFMIFAVWAGKSTEGRLNVLICDDSFTITAEAPFQQANSKFDFVCWDTTGKKTYEEATAYFKEKEKYDLLLYIPHHVVQSQGAVAILNYKKQPSGEAIAALERLINLSTEKLRLAYNDVDEETFSRIRNRVSLRVHDINSGVAANTEIKAIVGILCGVLIFMFIFVYGVQVMRGVIEEKSSRIVEVIISSVKPFQLMMGKIIGIMFVGLTQFLIWIIITFGIMNVASSTLFPKEKYDPIAQATSIQKNNAVQLTPEEMAQTQFEVNDIYQLIFHEIEWFSLITFFLIFFIGGYLLYGSLMAAIGAAVDSETDTQQFMLPITAPLMFSYLIIVMFLDNPGTPSTAFIWGSIIPFTSPVIMLTRLSVEGFGAIWPQLLLSVTLLIGTFFAIAWLAGKIYRTGILMYGKKISYKEIIKWLRYH